MWATGATPLPCQPQETSRSASARRITMGRRSRTATSSRTRTWACSTRFRLSLRSRSSCAPLPPCLTDVIHSSVARVLGLVGAGAEAQNMDAKDLFSNFFICIHWYLCLLLWAYNLIFVRLGSIGSGFRHLFTIQLSHCLSRCFSPFTSSFIFFLFLG